MENLIEKPLDNFRLGCSSYLLKNPKNIERLLEKQVQMHPENPLYNFSLGNLYYEKGDVRQAEIYYKNALTLSPENPEVLNNLAWLYATSKIPELRKPQQALTLAQKAAQLDPKPYILDTLGESYFINGYYAEAVRAIEQAISAKPDNLQYYKNQLNKFKRYLDGDEEPEQPPDEDSHRYAI